jgi:hypothetical protein
MMSERHLSSSSFEEMLCHELLISDAGSFVSGEAREKI